MKLIITVQDDTTPFVADISGSDKLVIGRRDPVSGIAPLINLEPYGALEQGVSRRHAVILYRHNAAQLMDMCSPNGTYLNEFRLLPLQARQLRDGDTIRIGFITLTIKLENLPQTEPLVTTDRTSSPNVRL